MKHFLTLFTLFLLAFSFDAKSQCSSTQNYDLIVSNTVVYAPSPTSQYISAYVCTTGTLIDSMSCCTRFIHVESGGTLVAGPMAYGTVYLKSGATFNGQNTTASWMVFAETGANVINYTGNVIQCTAVTFPSANCATGVSEPASAGVAVVQREQQLYFDFASTVKNMRVELYDMSGRLLISEFSTNAEQHTMSTAGLPDGIYLCRVYKGDEVIYSEKIGIAR